MKVVPIDNFTALHPLSTGFVPSSSTKETGLIFTDEWKSESISGFALTCLGNMPALCHRNAATEAALNFFRLAGVEPPARLDTYASNEEAVSLARRFVTAGLRLATIYPQIDSIRALNACLVDPALYAWLNDKSNLESLCPAVVVPNRQILSREAALRLQASEQTYPLYAKGAFAGANGSGKSVRRCTNAKEFREMLAWFANVSAYKALILEREIPFTTTWCLNYAVLDRTVRWLGAAEQIFVTPGFQCGSRIDPDLQPPIHAVDIGREICATAQARGYRGLAGLDMCVDASGRLVFFDLNFRLVLSTCFILLNGGLEDRTGVSLTCSFERPGRLSNALARLEELARARSFIPLRLYDGSECKVGEAPSVVTGFVRGRDRDAAQNLVTEVESRLLH
jgi:hypothetical protein